MSTLRVIPSIEQLRQRPLVRELEGRYGWPVVIDALRDATATLRATLARGDRPVEDGEAAARRIEQDATALAERRLAPSLRPVVNASGVIIHTNLGRAPLARSAVDAMSRVAAGYSNLEFDLRQGRRGDRATHAGALLRRLTGAERGLVVNNNAAAVLLTLSALAGGREVIISRGELVEIGGGFRVPDVLRQSGARLREVGTTNRTRPEDYASAVSDRTALMLRVHPSNFRIEGFSERPSLEALTEVGRRLNVPVVEDLGSGNLYGPGHHLPGSIDEPTVRQSLAAGVAVCCISGDKLLGGPQAGIILGREAELDTIATHPLMRAVRADKLVYAALEATLVEHVCDRASRTVPVARMICTDLDTLRHRAQQLMDRVRTEGRLTVTMGEGRSVIGGGTTPGVSLPSIVLEVTLTGVAPGVAERRLRDSDPPIVGRVERDRLLLDLRTVAPEEDEILANALRRLSSAAGEPVEIE